jgi:hypothetical protein
VPDAAPPPDTDGDGVPDANDNCPQAPNPAQRDADADTLGDACDVGDTDGDGVPDRDDRCPGVPAQSDADTDADGVPDACDVCPRDADPAQADADADGVGDACEIPGDADADGAPDARDNCPTVTNGDQADRDQDGVGDLCDDCPENPDPVQADGDGDTLGDACDVCPDAPLVAENHTDRDGDGQPVCAGDCDDTNGRRKDGGVELCDGIDNDCDLETDEGFEGLGDVCSAGQGLCRVEGSVSCLPDGTVGCDARAGAAGAEVCNLLDDDCDGSVDEDLAGCCVEGATEACGSDVGACAPGERTCSTGGVWGPCDGVGPRAEQCNALDDDCNGVTDENLGIRRCGRGVCDHEVPACMGGVGMDCDPMEGALPEQCNGLDDDCDGVIDPPPCGDLAPLDWAILGPILGLLLTP